jgi:activator of HSP90 ATPase
MKDYKSYYELKTTPDQAYLGLTNPLTIRLWSGEEAEFEAEIGKEFSMFEGNITGIIIGLEPGYKIVQQWFFGDQEEASVVTMILHPKKNHTSLELRHTNIPDDDYENIVDGWNEVFMSRLVEFYDE